MDTCLDGLIYGKLNGETDGRMRRVMERKVD